MNPERSYSGFLADEGILAVDAVTAHARKRFDADGAGQEYYIPVTVKWAQDRLPIRTQEGDVNPVFPQVNPLVFLTDTSLSESATPPFLALVVGQYGMGKTETMRQVAARVEQYRKGSQDLRCLPLSLTQTTSKAGRVGNFNLHGMVKDLVDTAIEAAVATEKGPRREVATLSVYAGIRGGRVLLLLDGLDEICFDQERHRQFFAGLMEFLCGDGQTVTSSSAPPLGFRVVVTMRREYLQSFADVDAQDLTQMVREFPGVRSMHKRSDQVRLHFPYLLLDAFTDSAVSGYLRQRSGTKDETLFKRLKERYPRLLDVLRRPLLLRIFYQLAIRYRQENPLFDAVEDVGNVADLVCRFVESADVADTLLEEQRKIARYTWDADQLASVTLDDYRNGRQAIFDIDDARKFLKPADPREKFGKHITLEQVVAGLHKCPFLRKESDADPKHPQYVFAHRMFFEYFTAQGIKLELPPLTAGGGFTGFDELVLNVDVRQLLKGIVGDEDWYDRTRHSYGLKNLEEWRSDKYPALHQLLALSHPAGKYGKKLISTLDLNRCLLLDVMTEPGELPDGAAGAVVWFIEVCEDKVWLHPRYLLYCQESVCVYLYHNRWRVGGKALLARFGTVLERQLDDLVKDLQSSSTEDVYRTPHELLLERTLDIGRRLRFQWSRKFVESHSQLLNREEVIRSSEIRNRLRSIASEIRQTIY